MRIFPPPLDIGDNEGFDPQKDIFGRAEFGRGIANLLQVSDDPLVIMLDAPWGMGKTTFISMLTGHLRNEGFPVIYFDAFKNDHVDDGFLAIAGEIIRLSNDLKKEKTPQYKNFIKKAARAGSSLLRSGAKIGVKAATLGAIDAADLETLKSVANDVAKETSSKADQYIENLLKLQSHEHETINGVRQALGELASCLAPTKDSKVDGDKAIKAKPLVFIIDELDRCKPTFALELLEKIKHIFSVPNVHFVLSTHLLQLENTVRFSYGAEVDARTYLQKFYNVILHFPEQGSFRSERIVPKYCSYLARTMSLSSDDLSLVQNVAEAKHLSLRTIERVVTCLAIAKSFTPKNYMWLDPIISGLAVIKIIDAPLFQRMIAGRAKLDEVQDALGIAHWPIDGASSDWVVEWWTYCLADKEEDYPNLDWRRFRQSLFSYSIRDRKDIVRFMANNIGRLQLPK